jgi:hypothetical protein
MNKAKGGEERTYDDDGKFARARCVAWFDDVNSETCFLCELCAGVMRKTMYSPLTVVEEQQSLLNSEAWLILEGSHLGDLLEAGTCQLVVGIYCRIG